MKNFILYRTSFLVFLLYLFTLFTPQISYAEVYSNIFNFGSYGTGANQFDNPAAIDYDSSGNIYIADSNNCRVVKYTSSWGFITQWGSCGAWPGTFSGMHGLAVSKTSGFVYVHDDYGIQKFTNSGTFVLNWGSWGSGNYQFYHNAIDTNQYTDLAIDTNDNVYVADDGNNRVLKYTANGVYITQWGTLGSGDGQFNHPKGIAVDTSSNVYVVERNNNRIQKFTSNGVFIAKWGTIGTSDGQFLRPSGAAVDSYNNVYVTDSNNNRIQKFDSNGVFLSKWGYYPDISRPSGIIVHPNGNIFVVDSNFYRIRVLSAGNQIKGLASSLDAVTTNGSLLPSGSALSTNTSEAVTLKKGSIPISDVTVSMSTDRNWSSISANISFNNNKPVISGDFENSIFPLNEWTTAGNVGWYRNTSTFASGVASASSGNITDYQTSWIKYDLNSASNATLTFDWKVSSEETYDFLIFCLDNDACTITPSGPANAYTSISGNVGWSTVNVPITAGSHSIKWLYGKDSSVADGEDKGWIDNVKVNGSLLTSTSNSESSGRGKSVVSGLSSADGVIGGTHTLYVPRALTDTFVVICPDAQNLSQVSGTCSNAVIHTDGDGVTSIADVSGQSYWKVSGLTGTGGISNPLGCLQATNLTLIDDTENTSSQADISFSACSIMPIGSKIQLNFPPQWDLSALNTSDVSITTPVMSSSVIKNGNVLEVTLGSPISALTPIGIQIGNITKAINPADSGVYYVGILTTDNFSAQLDQGSVDGIIDNANNANIDNVLITAQLFQQCSLDLGSADIIDLGLLVINTDSSGSHNAQVDCNAQTFTIALTDETNGFRNSAGDALGDASAVTANPTAATLDTCVDSDGCFGVTVNGGSQQSGDTDFSCDDSFTSATVYSGMSDTQPITICSATGPVDSAGQTEFFNVAYGARVQPDASAGIYSDLIFYTLTPAF